MDLRLVFQGDTCLENDLTESSLRLRMFSFSSASLSSISSQIFRFSCSERPRDNKLGDKKADDTGEELAAESRSENYEDAEDTTGLLGGAGGRT